MKIGDVVTFKPHVSADLGSFTSENRWPKELCLVVEVIENSTFSYRQLYPDCCINPNSNIYTGELQEDYVVLHPGKLEAIIEANKDKIEANKNKIAEMNLSAVPEVISISIQTVKGRRILI